MSETSMYAVAISPDKRFIVVKRGDHYGRIDRLKGVTPEVKWRDSKLLDQMMVKGGYHRLKKPLKYKGLKKDKVEKSCKSIARVDEKKGKKKDKNADLIVNLGLQNFKKDIAVKSESLVIDLEKADNKHLPDGAERFSYKCTKNRNIVYIPVNRLKEVYQTKEALNQSTINRKMKEMKSGKAMPPVYVGYNYDVHDGHHSWNAAMQAGYTHVPCEVVGSDPKKVKEAIAEYKKVWKSENGWYCPACKETFSEKKDDKYCPKCSYDHVEELKKSEEKSKPSKEEPKLIIDENKRIDPFEDEKAWENRVKKNDKEFRKELGISKADLLILDLEKAILNRGKLVKRRVAVRGKNGKVFYRMQWVDPTEKNPNMEHPGVDHTTFKHHEEGLKEMERRQSNRFPVVHHPTSGLKVTEHNYTPDKKKLSELEEKYKKGEALPPLRINPHGEVLQHHELLDLARKHGLSHVPSVVVGNPELKKQLEERLKDKVTMKDEESGEEVNLTAKHPNEGLTSETVADLDQFNNFTKKKYTKEHLMNEAERQGINWNKNDKDGNALAKNSKIMWMRAHQAIVDHIKKGNTFEVSHDEKDVDKRMQQDGKNTIHKHFLKLLEKHGSKDALMEWAKENGITWKENHKEPSINWMRAVVAIKNELAKGRMVGGVRTRQKGAQKEANRIVTQDIKDQVKAMGHKYGKSNVMRRAEEMGIVFDRMTKKGDQLPENSNILWMRAHEAISKYIADGNQFRIGDEPDTGITATIGDFGGVTLSHMQTYAVDFAKRKSQRREEKSKKYAIKALMVDKQLSPEQAEEMYNKIMERARNARVMVHFDPMEILNNGSTLLEQFSSDGEFKNDYELNRGYDRDAREVDERNMFGDDYDDATDSDRPTYGVVDLFNKGLKSNPYAGECAFVLKDDAKKRVTGSHVVASDVGYGEEGKWVRSMEDPHQLIIDRWTSRWKQPNKADKQRERAFDAIMNGKTYNDDNKYFETHVHGGLKFDRDVDHILVPNNWKYDANHAEKHQKILDFANLHGLDVKYETGGAPTGGGNGSKLEPNDISKSRVERDDSQSLKGVSGSTREYIDSIKNKDNHSLDTYHTTLLGHLGSIAEKGLIPGFEEPAGQGWKGDYSGKGNYLHSAFPAHELDNADPRDIDETEMYKKDTMESMPAVIHLKTDINPSSHESRSKLIPEEENTLHDQVNNSFSGLAAHKEGGGLVYKDQIDPSNIQAITALDHPEIRKYIDGLNLNVPVHYRKPKEW